MEVLRAKRMEEQRNEISDKIVGLSGEALAVIEELMHGSEDDALRLKAAQDILNRGGMKQAQEISVTHTNTTSPTEVLMEKLNSLTRSKRRDEDEDIIDAEIEESTQDEQD